MLAAGGLVSAGLTGQAVQINEIRIDEPGTDVNEYVELKGTPGEPLDGLWYVIIGDHSNRGNTDPDPPFYGTGTVEFAFDLTGFSIPDDGYFLLGSTNISLVPLTETDFDLLLVFENSENHTHLLVRNYTGPAVEKDADQYGDKAVDIDDNDDGIVNATLPWSEIVDGVTLVRYFNDNLPEGEGPEYGTSLGTALIGPDRAFTPGHVFRSPFDNSWNIGPFSLVGGLNLDTPGSENAKTPFINFFLPGIAAQGETIRLSGTNFGDIESVKLNGQDMAFNLISSTELDVTLPSDAVSGPILLTTAHGVSQSSQDVKVLPGDRRVLLAEAFELNMGDFLIVSVQGTKVWVNGSFNGLGYAQMAGFDRDGIDTGNEDWLISPEIDLTNATDPILNLATARAFAPDAAVGLEVLISSTYVPGFPDINDWTVLNVPLSSGSPNFAYQESGNIDLSAYIGQTVRIAFRYTSISSASADAPTWQVHEIYVTDAAFTPGWDNDPIYGMQYWYSPEWAYNMTLGYVYYGTAPWVYTGNFGYIYLVGGSINSGAWVYLTNKGIAEAQDFVWVHEGNEGAFWYSTGQQDNFLDPQFP